MKADSGLERFASGATLELRLSGLLELIKTKAIHDAVGASEFEQGLRYLVETAASSEIPIARLKATSGLARIAAVVRSLRGRIEAEVRMALMQSLPPLSLLDDAEDRLYVARACAMA